MDDELVGNLSLTGQAPPVPPLTPLHLTSPSPPSPRLTSPLLTAPPLPSPLLTAPPLTPPDSTMAEKAERWQLRGSSSVSPGPAEAMTDACMPALQPFTRNQVWSAPNVAAASCWASLMTPLGEDR